MAKVDGDFLALWYWPTSPKGLHDGPNAMKTWYVNCLARTWKPDRMYRGNDWIVVNSVFVSWTHSRKLKSNFVTVQGFLYLLNSILIFEIIYPYCMVQDWRMPLWNRRPYCPFCILVAI